MFGCKGCENKWTGPELAHCPGCHETFWSVKHFDHHRESIGKRVTHKGSLKRCVKPQDAGMVKGGRGKAQGLYWVYREPSLEPSDELDESMVP